MRRFMHGSIIALGLALALQQPSFAQAPAATVTELRSGLEQGKLTGIVDWLKADVERGRIPGAVVLIAQDGKIAVAARRLPRRAARPGVRGNRGKQAVARME